MTTSIIADLYDTTPGGDHDAVRVEGLGKQYRSGLRRTPTWALRDCSFTLPRGRVAALVGQNGAGKTTLLSVLSGLLAPTEGTARVRGVEVADTRGHLDARVAFVAQDKPLYRHLAARDMLWMGAGLNRVWDQQRALRWLDRFDIPLGRPCGKLSGGQQAQVSFAVALGARPSVLLLDEPLANLDPLARREVMRELLAEAADTGMTVLLSTHVIAELGGVADYLLLLAHGSLLADGEVDDILDQHRFYTGPPTDTPPVRGEVLHAHHTGTQTTFLLRLDPRGRSPEPPAAWTSRGVTLEDFVVAHLENSRNNGPEVLA